MGKTKIHRRIKQITLEAGRIMQISSIFRAYSSPVDQYAHLPPRVSKGAYCECCV